MKDISFVVPVYNTPIEKLEKCIKSILELREKFDIEIVVVDDGSKDYIRTFFNKNFVGEVKYLNKENGGVSSARNAGMINAEGKFISFVDADDVILKDAFDAIDISSKYQFVIFDIDVIENCKKSTWKVLNSNCGIVEKKNVIEELVTTNRMNSPCAKLFLNDCIKQNGIKFDENMVTGEDMNFVIDYIQCVTSVYYTGISSYCYQREEASRVSRIEKFPEIYLSNMSGLRDKLEALIKEYNIGDKYVSMLNMDHIESLYNYVSDLMTLRLFTSQRKESVCKEVQELKVDCFEVSRKKRIKYELLYHENWILIYMLAYLRKIYLRLK